MTHSYAHGYPDSEISSKLKRVIECVFEMTVDKPELKVNLSKYLKIKNAQKTPKKNNNLITQKKNKLKKQTYKVNFTGGATLIQHQAVDKLAKHIQEKTKVTPKPFQTQPNYTLENT